MASWQLGEAIATYAACFRALGQHCAYSKSILGKMLRDAFIFGMNDVQFLRHIFQEKEVTLQSVIELVSTMELSAKDMSWMHSKPTEQSVHWLTDVKAKPRTEVTCFRCRGPYLATKCRFINAICRACSKKGHIVKVCHNKNKQSSATFSTAKAKKQASTHQVSSLNSVSVPQASSDSDNNSCYPLFSVPAQTKLITLSVWFKAKSCWWSSMQELQCL